MLAFRLDIQKRLGEREREQFTFIIHHIYRYFALLFAFNKYAQTVYYIRTYETAHLNTIKRRVVGTHSYV